MPLPIRNVTSPSIFEFLVPANTLEAAPFELKIGLPQNKVASMQIIIPYGHQGLARIRVESQGIEIVPAVGSNTRWLRGDNFTLEVNNFEVTNQEIKLVGFNLDTVNDHIFILNIKFPPNI
jgi:hypothetical protein